MWGMMKTVYISIIFCLAWLLIAPNISCAQDEVIKVRFEIDGKEIHQPFKILLSVQSSAVFEPPITDDGFTLPPELRGQEKINIRLLYKKYGLDYGDIHISKFSGEMVFGIDNKPFDEERVRDHDPKKEIMLIYYLESGRTVETTYIYK
jgi:hypothetical protein